jgi:hypothetical protein
MQGQVDDIDKMLSEIDFDVISWDPIHWRRVQTTPVYIVRAREGKFFLKLIAPPVTRKQIIIRFLFGSLALKNQLAVYASLRRQNFHNLRYPKLVHTDGKSYLLLEFIPIQPKGERDLPEEALITSLLEFQGSGAILQKGLFESVLLNVSRKPFWVLLKRVCVGLRKQCGLSVSLQCLRIILVCYKRQKQLEKSIILHNDFHHNNLLLDENGRIFVCDFEKAAEENRWPLIDIVHYAVGTGTFGIEVSLIKSYLQKLQGNSHNKERLHVPSQLRIALLIRVSQMILSNAPPADVKEKYKVFLVDILLDDYAFDNWYEKSGFNYIALGWNHPAGGPPIEGFVPR